MSKPPAADSASLRAAGRNIETPFTVHVHRNSWSAELTCTRAMRILPGKRLVFAGEKEGEKVVAKFFLDRKKGERHCSREERGIAALHKAGIHAPQILLRGRLHHGKEPVLVFQKIQPALGFSEAWEQADTDTERRELLKHLVSVTAAMHEAGLVHKDAHPGNFMLSGTLMYAVDGAAVHTAHQGRPLSRQKSLKNLGAFFAQFSGSHDNLLNEAFQQYLKQRGLKNQSGLSRALATQIRLQRKKREQKYLKKIYRESSARVCRKSSGWFLLCDRSLYTENMARFLAEPDRFMDSARLLKDGNSSTVALIEIDQQPLVVKRYNIKDLWHGLRRCPRPSRAWHSWKNAHRLNFLGIATPKPIALIEKRWGHLRFKAYFITENTPGINAYRWFHSEKGKNLNQEKIVLQFGELLQKLYEARIIHGDFKATNFIISDGRLFVTDLDAMRSYKGKLGAFRRKFNKDCHRLMQNWTDLPDVYEMFYKQIQR
ncbi:MAG: lipopolysaccharide kinase InaA family protein [Desulfosalsimonadaceae bacterium]